MASARPAGEGEKDGLLNGKPSSSAPSTATPGKLQSGWATWAGNLGLGGLSSDDYHKAKGFTALDVDGDSVPGELDGLGRAHYARHHKTCQAAALQSATGTVPGVPFRSCMRVTGLLMWAVYWWIWPLSIHGLMPLGL